MVDGKAVVKNKAGIHCRPSTLIIQKVGEYPDCTFQLNSSKGDIDLGSILSLISLGISHGEEVTIVVEGEDEKKALPELLELFSTEFDFPPR